MRLKMFMIFVLALTCFLGETTLYAKEKWAPDFIIVGAQKSGTGALRKLIVQHPLIVFSKRNEVHFFDLNFEKGTRWYQSEFPQRPSPDHILGEKSPYYIVHPLVPERVHSLYPNVKIIMILRNPVSRAYSHYHFNLRKDNIEPLSFEEAIKAEPKRLAGEEKKLIKNPHYQSKNFKFYSYLKRGMYAEQVGRWFEFFPREQVLILTCEDLGKKTQEVMNEVFAFLELPPYEDLKIEHEPSNYPPINPETRKRLVEFFRPYNQQLRKLLGRDFDWDR